MGSEAGQPRARMQTATARGAAEVSAPRALPGSGGRGFCLLGGQLRAAVQIGGRLQTRAASPLHARPGAPAPAAARPRASGSQGRRRIVFADELRPRAPPHPKKLPEGPPSVPDYELKYPAVSDAKARSRYAAVFCDQYDEFLALQRQLGATQAKLCQLDALLTSLPPPRSQKEAGLMARLWMELEQKRTDPGFLARQARWRYLKGKLRHLKTQIRKFDDQRNSEGSVYF